MSDSEHEMAVDDQDDVAVETLGRQQRFDPTTGKPVVDQDEADDDADMASPLSSTAAYMSSMPGAPAASHIETHHLTLAQKNASNTGDLKLPHMLGIDEAGRGPVLGSMVYGICWCPVAKLDDLKDIKVADSKTLTFAQRQGLFANIQNCPWLGYEVDVISADRLSREMMRRQRVNLNAISHDSAIMLIQKVLDHGVNVREIYVDTVGDAGKYQDKLCGMFPGISITVSKKADSLFPIVSAASIAAKVTRDLNLDVWTFPEERAQPNGIRLNPASFPLKCSRKLGSGYPGDPMTKVWLQNHLDPVFGYPGLVRFSWGTTKKLLKAEAVQCEWGDEEDEENEDGEEGGDGGGEGSQKLGAFFSATEKPLDEQGEAKKKQKTEAATAAAAAVAATQLVTGSANNKKFTPLHDSITNKQHAVPQKERVSWFQQHQMHLATTF